MQVLELGMLTVDLAIVLVVFGASIFSKDIIKSAIYFGIGSALLAVSFFALSAPFAGAFEISIGAGLITVLTISTISLVSYDGDEPTISQAGADALAHSEVQKPRIKKELDRSKDKDTTEDATEED